MQSNTLSEKQKRRQRYLRRREKQLLTMAEYRKKNHDLLLYKRRLYHFMTKPFPVPKLPIPVVEFVYDD